MNIYHIDNSIIHIHNIINKTKEDIVKKAKHFKNNIIEEDFIEIDNVYKEKYIQLYEKYQKEKEEQLKALENLYNYIKEVLEDTNITDTILQQSLLEEKNIKKEIEILKKELDDIYK